MNGIQKQRPHQGEVNRTSSSPRVLHLLVKLLIDNNGKEAGSTRIAGSRSRTIRCVDNSGSH